MTEARDGKVSKRVFLRRAGLGALTTLLVPALGKRDLVHAQAAPGPSPAAGPGLTGDEALQKLIEGNRRHLSGEFTITQRLAERRQQVAKASIRSRPSSAARTRACPRRSCSTIPSATCSSSASPGTSST